MNHQSQVYVHYPHFNLKLEKRRYHGRGLNSREKDNLLKEIRQAKKDGGKERQR